MTRPALNLSRPIRALILGSVFGIAFFALAVRNVDFGESFGQLRELKARWLVIPLGLTVVSNMLRPLRWRATFPLGHRISFARSFGALTVGNMMNNFLPGRGGDLVRCYLGTTKGGMAQASVVLATMVLEKVLDGLGLLLIALTSTLFFAPPDWVMQLAVLASVLFAGAAAVLALLHFRSEAVISLFQKPFAWFGLNRFGGGAAHLLSRFAEGLGVIASLRQMAWLAILTLGIWITETALIGALAPAMGIHLAIPQMITVTAVIGLGLMIPSAPAFLGTYQFLVVSSLGLFAVDADTAFAFSLLLHAWVLVSTTFAGLLGGVWTGAGWAEMMRIRKGPPPTLAEGDDV